MPKMYKPAKNAGKKAPKKFEQCSRCPQPAKCNAAGKCVASMFGR